MSTETSRIRRNRTPLVSQFLQTECGLCCCAMVLAAHGSPRQIGPLRAETATGRDGLSMADLSRILTERGMRVRVYRAGVGAASSVPLPAIAYWDAQHMVVLDKVKRGRWYVLDPAAGRRTLTRDEFASHFSGVILTSQPGPGYLRRVGPRGRTWLVLLKMMSQSRAAVAGVLALSAMLYALTLALPLATERIIDTTVRDTHALSIVVGLCMGVAAYLMLSVVRSWVTSRIVSRLGMKLTSSVFGTLLTLPFSFFGTRSRGELMYRLSSLTVVRDTLSGHLTSLILDTGTLAVILVFAFSRSWSLAVMVVGLLLIMALATLLGSRATRRLTEREISANAVSTGMQMEAVASIDVLRVGGVTDSFLDGWQKEFERAISAMRRRMNVQGAVAAVTGAVQLFGPFLLLLYGISLADNSAASLGTVIAMQTLTATGLGAVQSLSMTTMQLSQVSMYVSRVSDILEHPRDDVFGDATVRLEGSVTLENVTFAYPGSQTPAVSEITLSVASGEKVAIVGRTGSGKSTIAQLMLGLHRPDSGAIRIDGRDLSEISAESLHDIVAWVPQEVKLSNRSIAENIDFGAASVRMEQVELAAAAAALDKDVDRMPLGYHTLVTETGSGLSGGQRQRIALARALMRNPRLLVLDEATSALDTVSEAKVSAALEAIACTQVIIAHRLSTIARADRVVVIDDGRIVQQGSHDELIAVAGPYQDLVRAQVDVHVDAVAHRRDPA